MSTQAVTSESEQLGKPGFEYNSNQSAQIVFIAIPLIFAALFLYFTVTSEGNPFGACVTIICFLWAGYWVVQAFLNRDLRVQVFENGMIYTRNGSKVTIPWSTVKSIWQDLTRFSAYGLTSRGAAHIYRIETTDGRKYKFTDSLRTVEGLGREIQQGVAKTRLPKMLDDFNKGETIDFDRLSLSQAGITKRGETLPWAQVQHIGVADGVITVRKEGARKAWAEEFVKAIPNAVLFLEMSQQVLTSQKKK
jgi:hypothetical protein